MTPDDDGLLTTERITPSRRAPLAVVLAAFALVALLIWKPWVGPLPASPSPTLIAARPTSPPTVAPTVGPTEPTPTPAPPSPRPTPELVTVDLSPSRTTGAVVDCGYLPIDSPPRKLAALEISPPLVRLRSDAAAQGLRRVTWRAAVQSNMLESIFSADWQTLVRSRRRAAPKLDVPVLRFSPITIDYAGLPKSPTLVVRVVVTVEWFGPANVLIGSREIVATTYEFLNGVESRLTEGCFTRLPG